MVGSSTAALVREPGEVGMCWWLTFSLTQILALSHSVGRCPAIDDNKTSTCAAAAAAWATGSTTTATVAAGVPAHRASPAAAASGCVHVACAHLPRPPTYVTHLACLLESTRPASPTCLRAASRAVSGSTYTPQRSARLCVRVPRPPPTPRSHAPAPTTHALLPST